MVRPKCGNRGFSFCFDVSSRMIGPKCGRKPLLFCLCVGKIQLWVHGYKMEEFLIDKKDKKMMEEITGNWQHGWVVGTEQCLSVSQISVVGEQHRELTGGRTERLECAVRSYVNSYCRKSAFPLLSCDTTTSSLQKVTQKNLLLPEIVTSWLFQIGRYIRRFVDYKCRKQRS